jgi:hypothetical protein
MKDIRVGDAVVAIRNGGHDSDGLPFQRPIAGNVYRITSVYQMRYGLGCTLRGMDPFPYRGYFLYVRSGSKKGWYFERLAPAEPSWTETLYELLRSKDHVK